jgi:hypothetical protein
MIGTRQMYRIYCTLSPIRSDRSRMSLTVVLKAADTQTNLLLINVSVRLTPTPQQSQRS